MGQSQWNPKLERANSRSITMVPQEEISGETKERLERSAEEGQTAKPGEDLFDSGTTSKLLFEVFQIIHSINNHLQVITINAEMVEMMAGSSNRYVDKILEASSLIRELMEEFRDDYSDQRKQAAVRKKRLDAEIGIE